MYSRWTCRPMVDGGSAGHACGQVVYWLHYLVQDEDMI
jgi:hypothetical protein|eukprot:COSAG01_NODE_3899_length_5566_cov_76.125663_4_plen_38_part_00